MRFRCHEELLICQVRIIDRSEPIRVAMPQYSSEFAPGHTYTTWDDQSRLAEVYKTDLPSAFDTPAVPEISREACLSAVRHACVPGRGHIPCIVTP